MVKFQIHEHIEQSPQEAFLVNMQMSFRNFKLNRAIGLESQILTLLSPKFKRDYRKKKLG